MKKEHSILLITDINYWKQEIGSHQRVYTLVDYLNLRYNLVVAYINKKKAEDFFFIKELNHNIIFIEELSESNYEENKINTFLEKNPILKQFYSKEIVSKIQTLLEENDFSSIIVEYIKLSYLFPLFEEKKTILDSHDIMNKRNESFKRNNQKHWIDINEKEELKILSKYDKVVCIQEVENSYLLQNDIESICCPHPIKINNFFNITNSIKTKKIIFIGGFSIANNNSIKWFIDNIWQTFENIVDIELHIYGSVSKSLKDYDKRYLNLKLHGKINDLSQAYQDALIAINPVQMGGGLKIKNIEALAYGIPLITTTEGSKGLESQINNSFLLANSKDEWIEKIISLVVSKELRIKLSTNSISYMSKYFNSEECFKKLTNFLNQ